MDSESGFSILIVDDSPINLKLLETTLGKDGYRVISAGNGPRARSLADRERPNLILLDIRMPDEDGFEVIKSLKKNPHTVSIPVIFLSGVSDIDAKLSGFELGAVDYITKPFHPKEVLARVRLHLKLSIATNSMIKSQAQKLRQITEAQTSLLTTPEMLPEADFGVFYNSLQEAGGDLYDVLGISQDIFGYFIADFSGHDIKTSYLTASLKALLKQNVTAIYSPYESMDMINQVLVEILPHGKYLTACYARLNRKTRQMIIINAGHPPAVYVPLGGAPKPIKIKGDILGAFKNVYFERQTIDVADGDRFFFYSDGLIESSCEKKVWAGGADDLLVACGKTRDITIGKAPGKIAELLGRNRKISEDDITILGVQV